MKLYCEVNLKDRTPSSILDAIAYACRHEELWKVRLSRQERAEQMKSKTDLRNKCGSCIYFNLFAEGGTYGKCKAGHTCKPRSSHACKLYERKRDK